MKNKILAIAALTALTLATPVISADKIPVGKPKDEKVPLEEPKLEESERELIKEVRRRPTGVNEPIQTNADGSFRALFVKAVVEIDDALGAAKGERFARKDAEIQCKRNLAQWLDERKLVFSDASGRYALYITKGKSDSDAAGTPVRTRNQDGVEYKVFSEAHASIVEASLRGLTVLHEEVTKDAQPKFMLVMGLSQSSINHAIQAKKALANSGNAPTGSEPVAPSKREAAYPAPKSATSPSLKDYLTIPPK